ncbi:hypothetical protein JW960_22930 [candidate division KSB1 bacterium]|nr:hypothetical protein [candidate division KSB1 bacterium]
MKPSVMMIVRNTEGLHNELHDLLNQYGCELVIEESFGHGIEHAQNHFFNAIVLDTKVKDMELKQAIKIFKNLDPNVKIIVTTDSTSKTLETDVRKERIYYYHIYSFDPNDLKLAIKSAISNNIAPHIQN